MLSAAAWASNISLSAPGIPQFEGCVHDFPAGPPEVCQTRLKPWAFSLSSEFGLGFPREEGNQDQHYFDCDNIDFPLREQAQGQWGKSWTQTGLGCNEKVSNHA